MTNGKSANIFSGSIMLSWALQEVLDDEVLDAVLVARAKENRIFNRSIASRIRYTNVNATTKELVSDEISLNAGAEIYADKADLRKNEIVRSPSKRVFSDSAKISEKEMLDFLFDVFGEINGRREYPSGGSLYPNEVIVGIFEEKISGTKFKSGYYHYLPKTHAFEQLSVMSSDALWKSANGVMALTDDPYLVTRPCFFVVYCCYLPRAIAKYRYHGYRLATMEVGAMFQLAAMKSQEKGWGNVVWGAFCDTSVSKAMQTNPRVLAPMVIQMFGP